MLILASQSATRKALLSQVGLQFEAYAATLNEQGEEAAVLLAGGDGRDVALLLARRKAEVVSSQYPGTVVIGADQVLTLGSTIFHKPVDQADARMQLAMLRGKTHRLHAAVTLVRDGRLLWSDLQRAELTLRDFSDAELDDVLSREGDTILQSVGAYRLEGPSIRLFATVVGDYFTILGLPLLPLLAALRQHAPETLA